MLMMGPITTENWYAGASNASKTVHTEREGERGRVFAKTSDKAGGAEGKKCVYHPEGS